MHTHTNTHTHIHAQTQKKELKGTDTHKHCASLKLGHWTFTSYFFLFSVSLRLLTHTHTHSDTNTHITGTCDYKHIHKKAVQENQTQVKDFFSSLGRCVYLTPSCSPLPFTVFIEAPPPHSTVSMATLTSRQGRHPHSCCAKIQWWVTDTRLRTSRWKLQITHTRAQPLDGIHNGSVYL